MDRKIEGASQTNEKLPRCWSILTPDLKYFKSPTRFSWLTCLLLDGVLWPTVNGMAFKPPVSRINGVAETLSRGHL